MRRARLTIALLVFTIFLLASAPAAFATATGGQGWYGETSDKTITQAMFIVIAFFPAVIIVFSVIQWALDKRKHARWDAQKRRAASADWRGGW
jgi:uncharacterized membrane protein